LIVIVVAASVPAAASAHCTPYSNLADDSPIVSTRQTEYVHFVPNRYRTTGMTRASYADRWEQVLLAHGY
jgi:hypothetical protein